MGLARLFLVASAAVLAGDERTVSLPHAWPAGSRYHVEILKSREEFEGGKSVSRNTTRNPVDVEVLARRTEGYTLRWRFGKPVVSTDALIPGALVDRIAGLVEGLTMDLIADASGTVTGLADRASMEAHFERAGGVLVADVEARRALDAAQLDALKRSIAALRGSALESAYLQAPQLLTLPSGARLELGLRREYEDRLPNPFGGEPLPSRGSLVLTRLDRDKGEAVVDWRHAIDPERAGPILEASIRAFAARTGQDLPKEAALAFDAIEDAGTWVYDLATGIPKAAVTTRTTTMAGRRRVDTQEFKVSGVVVPAK